MHYGLSPSHSLFVKFENLPDLHYLILKAFFQYLLSMVTKSELRFLTTETNCA